MMILKLSSGFTLIELMVVVAMIAITLTLGVPAFTDTIHNNRIATQANQFVGLLAVTRSAAVTRGLQARVCPSNASGTGCAAAWFAGSGLLAYVDANTNNKLDGGEQPLRVVPGMTNGNTLTGPVSVGFDSAGAVIGGAAVIYTICDPKIHSLRTITISINGHSRIAKDSC